MKIRLVDGRTVSLQFFVMKKKPAIRVSVRQACAIPYRLRGDRIEVCLVTSMKKRRWIFPKGVVEHEETHVEAALKEAWEEAGLRGRITRPPIGAYRSKKWGAELVVKCYLMQVVRQFERWPEVDLRNRCWIDVDDLDVDALSSEQRAMFALALKTLARCRSAAG